MQARWIFGYGSLIWRPDFDYLQRRKAAVRGWQRRFWQASPDHRGVPSAPGRVLTLVAEADAHCWGVAFEPPLAQWDSIVAELDRREQNGYEPTLVELEFDDGTRDMALTYIAGPDNPSFVGPCPLPDMIDQIATAHGPSGPNRDYLLELALALDTLEIFDEEIQQLRRALLTHHP